MNKGFTLIELLAVISIVLMLSMIVAVSVNSILKDSKGKLNAAQKRAIEDAAGMWMADNLDKIPDTENSCVYIAYEDLIEAGYIDQAYDVDSMEEIDDELSVAIRTTINKGNVVYKYEIDPESMAGCTPAVTHTYTVYNPGDLVKYDPVSNKPCTTGETCYKWRVITVGDTSSDKKITLQMDHNLINKSAWVTKADYNDNTNWGNNGNTRKGPVTIIKALENATASWHNSLKLNYTYDTSLSSNNYGTLSCVDGECTIKGQRVARNLKARIITGDEIRALTVAAGAGSGTGAYNWTLANSGSASSQYHFSDRIFVIGTTNVGTGSTTLSWLVENTNFYVNSGATDNTYDSLNNGYWTLTPVSNTTNAAIYISKNGTISERVITANNEYGIRPVITVAKKSCGAPMRYTHTSIAYTSGQLLQYDPVNNVACTTGSTCYKWRVITTNDNNANATITLQMDHNMVNKVDWIKQSDYNDAANWNSKKTAKGPITALKALETATSNWSDNLRLTYYYNTKNATNNYGELKCINGICKIGDNQVTTDLKARLITGEEVSKLTVAAGAGSSTNAATWTVSSPSSKYYYFSNSTKVLGTTNTGTGSTTLSWLIENTTASTNSGATSSVYGGGTNYGYWSLSPTSNTNSSVWLLHYTGKFDWYSVGSGNYGIRPVITIPKSIFAS